MKKPIDVKFERNLGNRSRNKSDFVLIWRGEGVILTFKMTTGIDKEINSKPKVISIRQ